MSEPRPLNSLTREELVQRLEAAEYELGAAARAREARQAEAEALNYSISHDLRAPLRAIRGFGDILQRRYRTALDEKGRQFLDDVIVSAATLDLMIEDLLRYARLGRRGVETLDVPLQDVVSRVLAEKEPRVRESNASIETNPLPVVRGDPSLLAEIVRNLLDNAVLYCPPGESPRVEISGKVEGGWAVLSVRDEGIGIAAAHHARIFSLFQRLHTPEEYPGRGVGLSLVLRSAALMGGKVQVESAPGAGSTFLVVLPAGAVAGVP